MQQKINITITKKVLILFWILYLFSHSKVYSCDVSITGTEIINGEFYINFTTVVEKIFQSHGYTVSKSHASTQLTAKNFVTTGSNYLKLKQANVELIITTPKDKYTLKGISSCHTVSCPAYNYIKAIKKVLKKLDRQIVHCTRNNHPLIKGTFYEF